MAISAQLAAFTKNTVLSSGSGSFPPSFAYSSLSDNTMQEPEVAFFTTIIQNFVVSVVSSWSKNGHKVKNKGNAT
jgi:hypothetical protein